MTVELGNPESLLSMGVNGLALLLDKILYQFLPQLSALLTLVFEGRRIFRRSGVSTALPITLTFLFLLQILFVTTLLLFLIKLSILVCIFVDVFSPGCESLILLALLPLVLKQA